MLGVLLATNHMTDVSVWFLLTRRALVLLYVEHHGYEFDCKTNKVDTPQDLRASWVLVVVFLEVIQSGLQV